MKIKQITAKSISYGGIRAFSEVKAIAIHYTGGSKDTAVNEGNYFANGNTRKAGAHFFVDLSGDVVQSIPIERIAWSVGGSKYSDCRTSGGGRYYLTFTNRNTVSIELCAIANREPSDAQVAAVKELIAYIRSKCPNAKTICRHFDITGKRCPLLMCTDASWNKFLDRLNGSAKATAVEQPKEKSGKAADGSYKVKVTCDVLNVRKRPNGKAAVVTQIKRGEVYTIVSESKGWGKLKSGAGWIYLRYTKTV